jgi:thioredoxin 1
MPKVKVLKFSAEWCGPCVAMKPVVARFKAAHPEVVVEEVDIDKSERKAERYGVQCVPTFVFEQAGKVIGRQEGFCSLKTLERLLPSKATATRKRTRRAS